MSAQFNTRFIDHDGAGTYVVEYVTTNRRGGLEDREVVVFADNASAAVISVKTMDPKSAGHSAHLVEG